LEFWEFKINHLLLLQAERRREAGAAGGRRNNEKQERTSPDSCVNNLCVQRFIALGMFTSAT